MEDSLLVRGDAGWRLRPSIACESNLADFHYTRCPKIGQKKFGCPQNAGSGLDLKLIRLRRARSTGSCCGSSRQRRFPTRARDAPARDGDSLSGLPHGNPTDDLGNLSQPGSAAGTVQPWRHATSTGGTPLWPGSRLASNRGRAFVERRFFFSGKARPGVVD